MLRRLVDLQGTDAHNRRVSEPLRIVAVSGSPSTPSKTTLLVTELVEAVASSLDAADVQVIEVAGLRQDLAAGVWRSQLGRPAQDALDAVEAADLLIVGSPAYRATYTGALKTFFDQVGQHALAGTPVLLASTAASAGDAALVEHHLRALFAFFRSQALPVGVAVDDGAFVGKTELTEELRDRVRAAAAAALPLLAARV